MMNYDNNVSLEAEELDHSKNWKALREFKEVKAEIKALKRKGLEIEYYDNFVIIDGVCYNVHPSIVRKL